MRDEQVFRFMALRQPAKKEKQDVRTTRTIDYSVTGTAPPLVQKLFAVPREQRTPDVVQRELQMYRDSDRNVAEISALPFDLAAAGRWAEENAGRPLKDLSFESAPEIVAKGDFIESADRLAEALFAETLGEANAKRRRDDLVHAIKLLHVIRQIADGSELLESDEPLGEYLARTVVVVPYLELPKGEVREPSVTAPPPPDDPDTKGRRERLARLTAAHRELAQALSRPEAVQAPPREAPKVPVPTRPVLTGTTLSTTQVPAPEIAAATGLVATRPQISFAPQTTAMLSRETTGVLDELKIDMQNANPFAAVTLLETQIANLSEELPAMAKPRRLIAFGGGLLDLHTFAMSYGKNEGQLDPSTLPQHLPCRFLAGIGDLLIVRQKLKAYELGDFAHVENVLIGETREREHRRLNLREEITVLETERETEKERDLQSTERNEMQNEASRTVQSQFQLEAGLQVSGSYGPAVSFSASLNTSFSTSTEESQRKAVTYSREVTEKTSERIRERVREERRRRVLEQTEEINAHRFTNTTDPKGHIRGIYRWLSKIYDAQVFNYGQRMMYEFVVPEPAAYFLYAMIENPPSDLEIEKPEPPRFGSQPLKPENLTRGNYQQYLAQYNVTSAKAPPSSFTNIAYFEKQEGKEESHYERASKLSIPEGYEAINVSTNYWYVYGDDDAKFGIFVGSYNASSGWAHFGSPFRNEISVAVWSLYVKAFAATIDVNCRLTAEGFAKWQHETYAAILEAYLNQKATYEDKVAQAALRRGPEVLGRNPLENRRIERDELKKLVLMMLMQQPYLDINSYYGGQEPIIHITRACRNGSRIRFFENAFEWHNMTYVFYPYFWNRHARWISALHLTDPDPDFAGFLRAGAARVQVPVRPGFERAVAYFSQTGQIWEGNDVPLIGDDLYVPIVEEITEKLGKLDEGVPYPPGSGPWEVTVPTSLVIVQDLDEIPNIRDILTGNPIKLLPPNA